VANFQLIAISTNMFQLNRFLKQFSLSRRMIWFRSGSCLSKLERVKANSIEVTKIIHHYHISTMQPKYIGPVRFYALLFASSCRPKRNCPAAETERYVEKCYI